MDPASATESLSDFQSNAGDLIARVKRSGEPLVLTVDGKPEIVVQDAAAYRRLAALAEQALDMEAIRLGLEDVASGRTQPISEAFAEMRRELSLPIEP